MDEEGITIQGENDGSRKRQRKENKREARKKLKYLDPDPSLSSFTRPCNHNGKTYQCADVNMRDIRTLRKTFYNEVDKIGQDIKLCRFLSVVPAKRHRAILKPRNFAVEYVLTSGKKKVRVCQKFFISVLGVTKHRIATVCKVLEEGGIPREKRGGDRVSHKSHSKKQKVQTFIEKLCGKESHYNRRKSKRIYLSPNLSIGKLQKLYNTKCEAQDRVSYDMFRNIFINDFNIGFSSPTSGVCSKCTRLKQQIKQEKQP